VKTTRIPGALCPSCGELIDAASNRGDAVPKPSDLSVCVFCGAALVFGDNLKLRAMTAEEFAALPDEVRDFIQTVRDQFVSKRRG